MLTINCLTVRCTTFCSTFCVRCYLNVIALYTALELDVMIEHSRLTQTEGILSTDFLLKISFNLRFNSILPLRCVYTFLSYSHCELCLLRFVSGELNEPAIRHPYDRHMAR